MTGEPITVEQAKEMRKALEIDIMQRIKQYEDVTGMRVTKALMQEFAGSRFFGVSVWMPFTTREEHE